MHTTFPDSQPALTSGWPFASLLPESLARYRTIIVAAIEFFIKHLPDRRRAEIVQRWAQGPMTTPSEVRLFELLHCCPTLHKLGQVLARERRLPSALREQLQRLESMPPWTPLAPVHAALEAELGEGVRKEIVVSPAPIAEASVAVVVPFTWIRDGREAPIEGVFKVLKPGVETRIEEELAVWFELGAYLDVACEEFGAPPLDYRDTFTRVAELLRAEVRLDLEQGHLASAGETYRGIPGVVVPELLPFGTPRVTAMTRLTGTKVTDIGEARAPVGADAHRLARTIVEALIAAPMLSNAETAPFHADPHAGNLLATNDGRLGVLDWSLVGQLSVHHREQMAQVLLGAMVRGADCVTRAIAALAENREVGPSVRCAAQDALARLSWGSFPGLRWFTDLLDAVVLRGGVRMDGNLMLFRKALLTLEGVLEDVAPEFDVDAELTACVLREWAREWPMRWFAHPASRAFGTHLSNADLFDACVAVSANGMRGSRS